MWVIPAENARWRALDGLGEPSPKTGRGGRRDPPSDEDDYLLQKGSGLGR
jgi:hypothetical protein